MAENGTEKREALTPNWNALETSEEFGEKPLESRTIEVAEEDKADFDDKNEIKQEEVKTEENVEDKKEEVKEEEKSEPKTEPKIDSKLEEEQITEVLELKLDDVKGFEKAAEDGTWKAVAEGFGVQVKDDSFESFKESVDAKYKTEIEEARNVGIENIYSTLKPETVTALKLIEMGVPQEQAFNPTAELDGFLKMDDASLVRKELEGREGWDAERVELEMESLSENEAKMKHEALKLREWANSKKQEITAQRDALLNEYTQNKDRVEVEQRNQELSQIKSALDVVSDFMGAKINPEAKSAILQKHSRGDYGSILKDPKSIADYIYFKEFGSTILDQAKKGSYAKGKEEYAKHMLKIPPKSGEVASKVSVEKQVNQLDNPFKSLEAEFG